MHDGFDHIKVDEASAEAGVVHLTNFSADHARMVIPLRHVAAWREEACGDVTILLTTGGRVRVTSLTDHGQAEDPTVTLQNDLWTEFSELVNDGRDSARSNPARDAARRSALAAGHGDDPRLLATDYHDS